MRFQEQCASAHVGCKGGYDHRTAAHIVRHRPEHQQRDEDGDGVDGEDGGQRERGKPQLILVDAIQRRRSGSREQAQDQDPGYQPERSRLRQRHPPVVMPGGPGCRLAEPACVPGPVDVGPLGHGSLPGVRSRTVG